MSHDPILECIKLKDDEIKQLRQENARLSDRLSRVRSECDAISDGAPDAAPCDKFANQLLGIIDGGAK